MVKTSCFKRTMAILLSVLLAMPLFVMTSFAEGDGFTRLNNTSALCETGEMWYNRSALASATGTQGYQYAYCYISEDGNTLKFEYTSDGQIVTELRQRETDPQYFDYLFVVPAFGDPLPTSEDGLEDGAYWYDQAGLIRLAQLSNSSETVIYIYTHAVFRMSVDETMLRMVYTTQDSDDPSYRDEYASSQSTLYAFLRQKGVDPNAGFTLLPTSEDGLQDGDYWFDLASFLQTLSEANQALYANAQYYISDDGVTLRISLGMNIDVTREDEPLIFRHLHQVGVDPNAGFTLLPTSEDDLEYGDYWYDAAGLIAAVGDQSIVQSIQFYLSDDGETLRMISPDFQYDFTRDDEEGAMFFGYLRQCGVDPDLIEGFSRLPITDEGLADGDYWYDVEGFVNLLDDESTKALYRTAKFYLSDDANTLRMVISSQMLSLARDSEQGATYFAFLRQVGVDPNQIPGFILLPHSDEGLSDGDYWYDAATFAEIIGNEEYGNYRYYLSEDGNTLRIMIETYPFDVVKGSESADIYFEYLRQVGVDPYPGFTELPKSDEGLSDGDYWYDAAGFAAMANDDGYLSARYMLSDDGNTLRITERGYTYEIQKGNGGSATYFVYLHKVGDVFTVLPTSDDGLEDGAYWYDAAGLAQLLEDDSYTTATYSLNASGEILCIEKGGQTSYYMDEDQYAYYFRYLYQAGVDPNEGFTFLPDSPDGLNDGDWWYDEYAFAVSQGLEGDDLEEFTDALELYLNEDDKILRIYYSGMVMDMPLDSEEGKEYAEYMHQLNFVRLPITSDDLEIGDYWYDAAALAAAEGEESLLTAEYYLDEDCSVLRIILEGYKIDFPVAHESSAQIVAHLHQVAEDPNVGFNLLPKSDAGLSAGDYWYNAAGLAAAFSSDEALHAEYYLSDDGETLRIVVSEQTIDFTSSPETVVYFYYLRQAGVDPNAGFNALPTSAEDLEIGDYWYDAAALAAANSDNDYLTAEYYLSEDGNTLRVVLLGTATDYAADDAQSADIWANLYQIPDPNAGFKLLPTSADGLEDGDYWYDLAALNNASGDMFTQAQFYLSDDGETLRVIMDNEKSDLTRVGSGAIYFGFLRQVGVDPNAGFNLLPASPDGLGAGDYWFDAEGLAALEGEEFLTAEYYLSEDGKIIRMIYLGNPYDITIESGDGEDIFSFLHQVTVPEDTLYLTLAAENDTIHASDTVTVTVDLAQNPGISAMSLTLQYDANVLTLTNVQTEGLLETGNPTIGGDYTYQPYNILWDDGTAHSNHTETGKILTLTFTVKDGVEPGETEVTLTYDADSTFDVDMQNVPVAVSGAVMTIAKHTPGDVDGDGEVDVADVVALNRYLVGGWDVTVDLRNSDVNGDGSLDLKDVVLLRRFLAGGWDIELV